MTAPTFIAPIDPSPGTGDKPEISLLKADFGDGYTQAARRLNNVRRVLSMKWERLTINQAASIVGFLTNLGGTSPFYYTPPGEAAPVLFSCEDFGQDYLAAGWRSVTATFRQSFNPV